MNDKIKELIAKATHPDYDSDDGFAGEFNKEKFAELIVRECARIIDRGNGEMCSIAEEVWCNHCRDHILYHFGLK